MELKDFSPLIQLCTVSNFLYSAVEHFSKNVQIFFSDPFKEIGNETLNKYSGKVRDINDSKAFKSDQFDTSSLKKEFNESFIELSNTINKFLKQGDSDMEYGRKFKSLYLIAGIFSFFLLLIIGLDDHLTVYKEYNCLFTIEISIALVAIYIFISTFFQKSKNINQVFIVLIIFVLIGLFKKLYDSVPNWLVNYIPSNDRIIIISIILICSPFFFHFLRILIDVGIIQFKIWRIRIKFSNKFNSTKREVDTLDKYLIQPEKIAS